MSSQDVFVHGQALTQRSIGVVAHPLGIGYGDQKQIQRRRAMGAAIDVVIADQAVVQPTELSGGFTDMYYIRWLNGNLIFVENRKKEIH